MDRDRGRPAPVRLRARPRDRQRDGHPDAAQEHGDVVRPGRQRRTATTTRSSARTRACGARTSPTTTATTCSTATTASTRTATGRRSGATTRRARRTSSTTTPTAARRRSPSPRSATLDALIGKLKPKFLLDYHSYGPLILYPEGWQVETPSTDTPATMALAGLDDDHPAITNFDPDVSGELYTTNGDVTDHVYQRYGSLAYTVELEPGTGPGVGGTVDGPDAFNPGGFVFQDSEAAVEDQFQRNLPFALDLARSAKNPGRPVVAHRQRRARLRAAHVQVLLRRPAARRGQRQPRPRPGRGLLARQRRRRPPRARPPSTRAASATARPASTTTSSGARSPASPPATRSRSGSRPAPRRRPPSRSPPRRPSPATCS